MPKMLPKQPARPVYKPLTGYVFCHSGNNGTKYHVAVDRRDCGFGPRCKARGANRGSVFAYPQDTTSTIDKICARCLQYTEEVSAN